jgi:hypothetical protein
MTVKTHLQNLAAWPRSGAGIATLSGLGAFSLALALLSLEGFDAQRSPAVLVERPHLVESAPLSTAAARRSLSAGILAGHSAVGVRLKADSVPLAHIRIGAALDVLATLPDGPDGPGLVGAVVTGARVVAVTPSNDHADILLDAPADEAMLLGHLVRGGLPLAYTVREMADEPRALRVLTLDETRARLSLAPRVTAPAPPPEPAAAAPVQPLAPGVSEVHFVVYTGVDLDLIEHRFEVSEAALRTANPAVVLSEPLVAGTELIVPGLYGFFYRVRPEDTLDSLSQRYRVSAERVRLINGLGQGVGLPVGDGLLIPTQPPTWAVVPRAGGE